MLKTLRETKRSGKKVNTASLKKFLKEQEKFLAHMNKEMIEDDQVVQGAIDDSHLLDHRKDGQKAKRARLD